MKTCAAAHLKGSQHLICSLSVHCALIARVMLILCAYFGELLPAGACILYNKAHLLCMIVLLPAGERAPRCNGAWCVESPAHPSERPVNHLFVCRGPPAWGGMTDHQVYLYIHFILLPPICWEMLWTTRIQEVCRHGLRGLLRLLLLR